MKNFTLFYGRKKNSKNDAHSKLKPKDNKARVPMFSDFFSNIGDDLFCTNEMYSNLKDQILSSISVYSPKVDITLDIYEHQSSLEDNRDFLIIGFRNYIEKCYKLSERGFLGTLFRVITFMLIGIAIIIVGYGLSPLFGGLQWPTYLITTIGTVLVWQFVGFWAFEYSAYKRELDRLKQIKRCQFIFKKWD